MKKLLKDGGFTLVELMVVVAIIGILSAVAIPNFKQYQAKSKTSEGKLQLASLYSAETAFMSDWDTYGSCLVDMGYSQTAKGYYAVGFSAAATTPNSIAVANGATCASGHQILPSQPILVGGISSSAGDLTGTVASSGEAFTISAAGKISSDTATIDTWTIDENKTLIQFSRGY